jgi:hypothetical protein
MRFKNPGGDLTWITPLWMLAGGFLAFLNLREGSTGLAILFGSLALCASLVWFDVKWAGVPLMTYFSLAALVGAIILVAKGFSWRMLFRIIFAGYTVYAVWEWRNRINDE